MIGCVLVTHGPVADALVAAAHGIIGDLPGVYSLSVSPLSLTEIRRRLNSIAENDEIQDGLIIMATLKGGSCWNAAREVAQKYSHVGVLSGVNLPMLISFLTKRQDLPFDKLVEMVCHDGIRGIQALPACD